MSNAQLNSTLKSWDIIASRVYSAVNANLTLEASGTSNLILKTNGNIVVTGDSAGNVSFSKLPICSVYPPTISSQLVNKQYADSLSGPQGPQGAQGAQGAQGQGGAQGAQGLGGPAGAQGAQGPGGPGGPAGAQGAQGGGGAVGAQGPGGGQGAQGAQGGGGSVGAQGPGGPAGFGGSQGPAGPAGFGGAGGPAGPDGPAGPAGPAGPSLLLTTSNPGISIGGTSPNYSLSLPFDVTDLLGIITDNNITTSGDMYLNNNNRITFDGGVRYFVYETSGSNFVMNDSLSIPLVADASLTPRVYGKSLALGTIKLYYIPSSVRYKENICPVPDNDEILKVQPTYFHYKDPSGNALPEKNIGFIAEEMAENEMGNYFVVRDAEGVIDGINPELMVPLYVSAMRLLRSNISTLEKSLQDFTNEIEIEYLSCEQSITELEAQFQNQ
jgi:hypothetical protein